MSAESGELAPILGTSLPPFVLRTVAVTSAADPGKVDAVRKQSRRLGKPRAEVERTLLR
jgi:hypothetical protein